MIERIANYLESYSPVKAAVWAFVCGLGLFLIGTLAYGETVYAPPRCMPLVLKAVGFDDAVNWSFTMVVMFPLIVLTLLSSTRATASLFDDLVAARMVWTLVPESAPHDPRYELVTGSDLKASWSKRVRRLVFWGLLLAAAGFIYSWIEWWLYSGGPLWRNQLPFDVTSGKREVDWSVAAIVNAQGELIKNVPRTPRVLNMLFSFAAFTAQGVWIAHFAWLLCLMMGLAEFIGWDIPKSRYEIVPNIKSVDRRRGFELFEPVVELLLLTMAGFYALFYFSRVWNVYLRDCHEYFLLSYVLSLDVRTALNIRQLDQSGLTVAVGALVGMVVSLTLLYFLLRAMARRGKHIALNDMPPATWSRVLKVTPQYALNRAQSMDYWPLTHLGATGLWTIVAIATLSMFVYQIAPVAVVLFILWLVISAALERLRRQLGPEPVMPEKPGHLPLDQIVEIHEAAIRLELSRTSLLQAIDSRVKATFPEHKRPDQQLFMDLTELNKADREQDYLIAWLETAKLLSTNREEQEVFMAALDAIRP